MCVASRGRVEPDCRVVGDLIRPRKLQEHAGVAIPAGIAEEQVVRRNRAASGGVQKYRAAGVAQKGVTRVGVVAAQRHVTGVQLGQTAAATDIRADQSDVLAQHVPACAHRHGEGVVQRHIASNLVRPTNDLVELGRATSGIEGQGVQIQIETVPAADVAEQQVA